MQIQSGRTVPLRYRENELMQNAETHSGQFFTVRQRGIQVLAFTGEVQGVASTQVPVRGVHVRASRYAGDRPRCTLPPGSAQPNSAKSEKILAFLTYPALLFLSLPFRLLFNDTTALIL